MKNRMVLSLVGVGLISNLSLSECASPKRTVYAHAFPASMTTIMLSNPSKVAQNVMIKVTPTGGEQIYNAHVNQKFGVCIWNGSGCQWKIPNGSTLSCNATSYNSCSGNFTLPAGGVTKLAFGSLLRMPCSTAYGCDPFNLDAPNAGSIVEISVCEDQGFLLGGIVSFMDSIDSNIPREINGGRPF